MALILAAADNRFILQDGKRVVQYRITHADASTRPTPKDFELDFPKAITLPDIAKKRLYSASKTWGLHNLPAVNSARSAVLNLRPPGPTIEMPGETTPGFPWAGILVGLGGLLLLLVTIRLVISRRRKAA
jgi:hypothetical protein